MGRRSTNSGRAARLSNRAISLYRNSIIDRVNADDILARCRRFAGDDDLCFAWFKECARTNADPHCVPQSAHLLPVAYAHTIPFGAFA